MFQLVANLIHVLVGCKAESCWLVAKLILDIVMVAKLKLNFLVEKSNFSHFWLQIWILKYLVANMNLVLVGCTSTRFSFATNYTRVLVGCKPESCTSWLQSWNLIFWWKKVIFHIFGCKAESCTSWLQSWILFYFLFSTFLISEQWVNLRKRIWTKMEE